jgi:hypothetical protein
MSRRDDTAPGPPAPDWFYSARDRLRSGLGQAARRSGGPPPPLRLRPAEAACPPVAGEICALFADDALDDPAAPLRLVLVRYVDAAARHASVALVSDDTRMAGGTDVVLRPDRTGLPYAIMVETDVVAPAWYRQFSAPLGGVDEQTLVGLCETEFSGAPAVTGAARGMPVRGPGDERWAFKLAEAEALCEMCASCIAGALEGREAAPAATDDAADEPAVTERSEIDSWDEGRGDRGPEVEGGA